MSFELLRQHRGRGLADGPGVGRQLLAHDPQLVFTDAVLGGGEGVGVVAVALEREPAEGGLALGVEEHRLQEVVHLRDRAVGPLERQVGRLAVEELGDFGLHPRLAHLDPGQAQQGQPQVLDRVLPVPLVTEDRQLLLLGEQALHEERDVERELQRPLRDAGVRAHVGQEPRGDSLPRGEAGLGDLLRKPEQHLLVIRVDDDRAGHDLVEARASWGRARAGSARRAPWCLPSGRTFARRSRETIACRPEPVRGLSGSHGTT
ncbi:MAG: hypothetical protein QM765_22030 [Myxococcales bacterium]